MILHLQGLTFKAHSPSDLELVSVRNDLDDPTANVRIRFDGSQWLIDYRSRPINVVRAFKSREAAVALLAERAP